LYTWASLEKAVKEERNVSREADSAYPRGSYDISVA
jgi:hypothetical protein